MFGPFLKLMDRVRLRRHLILIHDTLIVSSTFPLAIWLREPAYFDPPHAVAATYGALLLLGVTPVVFRTMGVQQAMWRYASPRDLWHLAKALLIVATAFLSLMFLIDRLEGVPRIAILNFWLAAFAILCSSRLIYISVICSLMASLRSKATRPPCRILIIAELASSSMLINAIRSRYGSQADLVGVVSGRGERGRLLNGIEILGSEMQISEIVASLEVAGRYPDVAIIDDQHISARQAQALPAIRTFRSSQLEALALFIADRPDPAVLFESQENTARIIDMKRVIDIAASMTALILLLPLLSLIAILLWFFHGSPIMFTQVRAGRRLREFHMLKFRTMKPPLDRSDRILPDQERITWVGSLLRATRLDELPQFWNVLRGDMSLIGPRPLLRRDMPSDDRLLAERYKVRPGITGWAQVNGGHKISNHQKMLLDIYYIRNCSIKIDIEIILKTIKTMTIGETINQEAIKNAEALV